MGIKRYIIATLILVVVIAGYVFSIESGDYKVVLLDNVFIFPIAVWTILPAIVLFIASLVHMSYYGLKSYLANRVIKKDSENLLLLLQDRLAGEKSSKIFTSADAKEIANVLSQIDVTLNDSNFSSSNERISKMAEHILNINAGKYVSSKEFKFSNENKLMAQNIKNRIDLDSNFSLEVVKQPSLYPADVVSYAFIKMVEEKSMTIIKKTIEDLTLDIDMLKAVVKKDSLEENELSLDNTILINLINKIDITNSDLIFIAKQYKKTMSPEQLIKLFEDIITKNEALTESYLYVLSEYEMLDNIREILVNSQKDEFIIYKAFLDLRDAGKHYSLDSFLK